MICLLPEYACKLDHQNALHVHAAAVYIIGWLPPHLPTCPDALCVIKVLLEGGTGNSLPRSAVRC